MNMPEIEDAPERIARKIVMDCADCDCCRPIMDESCLFFPELYRLYDKETETKQKISPTELRGLVEKCNFCALCPCPNIRADIIRAKTGYIAREGLPLGVRTIVDVERAGKLCGAMPGLANRALRLGTGRLIKRALGIHPDRAIPTIPKTSFGAWARREGLTRPPQSSRALRCAYFAGCTAGFLFPEVGIAAVNVLRDNGVGVWVPDQGCCGMPAFLEGDRRLALRAAARNLEALSAAVRDGCDIVCSCPTCSFMLRSLMGEGAYHSSIYQDSVGADRRFIKVPVKRTCGASGPQAFESFDRIIFERILRDEGYFSLLDPLKRIALLEKTFDLGEYLLHLHTSGQLKTDFGPVEGRAVYFPPCHQREQGFGLPYADLLRLVPGLGLEPIEGNLYCCGMGGLMGFKRDFHLSSIELSRRLIQRIQELEPEILVTDCLSCRLQFRQLLPQTVVHPLEILSRAYQAGR